MEIRANAALSDARRNLLGVEPDPIASRRGILYPARPIPNGNQLIEQHAGASWRQVGGRSDIEAELLADGNGSRGIVYGTDGSTAHVWNAVVQNDRVNFVDFQGIGPSGPDSFNQWTDFAFVRTN